MNLRRVALLLAIGLFCSSASAFEGRNFELMTPKQYTDLLLDANRAFEAKHYDAAFTMVHRAACAGSKPAQEAVGRMYLQGQGVKREDLTGYAWLVVAAEFPFPQYQTMVSKLRAAMTPEQLSIGAARADAIKGLYGLAATNMSCGMTSSAGIGTFIKDSVVCTPLPILVTGSRVYVRKCIDDVRH